MILLIIKSINTVKLLTIFRINHQTNDLKKSKTRYSYPIKKAVLSLGGCKKEREISFPKLLK